MKAPSAGNAARAHSARVASYAIAATVAFLYAPPRSRRYDRAVGASFEQRIAYVCSGEPSIVAVYLFGSTARQSAGRDSDVDVAVLFDRTPAQRLASPRFQLEGELERELGRRVDLVVLNEAPVDLRVRVLRDGRVLVDRDRAARLAFEVRTRNEAFDLEPILARCRAPRGAAR
ncbi:MAG: type VII toxin-antitoxin system MntA family adenylyltransferase antitoxin [Acidobacteriota bacterium]